MLLGLRPARSCDAIRQQLQFSYDDVDCPTTLMEVMELQFDKFEAAEETLGVKTFERTMGEPSVQEKSIHLARVVAQRRSARIRLQGTRGRRGACAI